jgi:hypothetical protein
MEQAVSVARDAEDANALGHSLLNFADLALLEGDPERAVELAQQSLS